MKSSGVEEDSLRRPLLIVTHDKLGPILPRTPARRPSSEAGVLFLLLKSTGSHSSLDRTVDLGLSGKEWSRGGPIGKSNRFYAD